MTTQVITEGDKFQFIVVGKTKSGKVVPLTDVTVTVDNSAILGTISANPDGTNGVFQTEVGKIGDGNITARAASVDSAPFPVSVVADNVVATVEIEPVVPVIEPT